MKKETVCLIMLLFLLMGQVVEAKSIRINSSVETRGKQIELGEIAEIDGEDDFLAEIYDITLGRAPLPGYQNYLYREQIISALEAEGIEVSRVNFDIPYQINVSADYKELELNKLIEKGREYIYQSLDYDSSDIEIEVLNKPNEILRPYGEVEVEIGNVSRRNLLGRTTIPIEVYVDGELYRRVHMRYNIAIWKEVLVAKDDISRGDSISLDDFEVEDKKVTSTNTSYISSEDNSLSSYELRTAIRAGRELETRMVNLPDLVDRWSDVELIAQIGDVQIITKARARDSGQLGDRITVENKTSGKRIEAEVVGEGRVRAVTN